jgi:hypothetical protein
MFRFPLLIAIVVVTGSFASKVEAGCSLKRWDWQHLTNDHQITMHKDP